MHHFSRIKRNIYIFTTALLLYLGRRVRHVIIHADDQQKHLASGEELLTEAPRFTGVEILLFVGGLAVLAVLYLYVWPRLLRAEGRFGEQYVQIGLMQKRLKEAGQPVPEPSYTQSTRRLEAIESVRNTVRVLFWGIAVVCAASVVWIAADTIPLLSGLSFAAGAGRLIKTVCSDYLLDLLLVAAYLWEMHGISADAEMAVIAAKEQDHEFLHLEQLCRTL